MLLGSLPQTEPRSVQRLMHGARASTERLTDIHDCNTYRRRPQHDNDTEMHQPIHRAEHILRGYVKLGGFGKKCERSQSSHRDRRRKRSVLRGFWQMRRVLASAARFKDQVKVTSQAKNTNSLHLQK